MNPNAMFDLFGEYSANTGKQIRKNMLKYLGITKKQGADMCTVLKNAWMPLWWQGKSGHEWADSMLIRDNAGDEITLFVLSRMYNWHTAVVTSAKIWCTLEMNEPMSEEEILQMCDLWVLYIKPGVYSELRLKPAMPPAPHKGPILESACAILPKMINTRGKKEMCLLNLSVTSGEMPPPKCYY